MVITMVLRELLTARVKTRSYEKSFDNMNGGVVDNAVVFVPKNTSLMSASSRLNKKSINQDRIDETRDIEFFEAINFQALGSDYDRRAHIHHKIVSENFLITFFCFYLLTFFKIIMQKFLFSQKENFQKFSCCFFLLHKTGLDAATSCLQIFWRLLYYKHEVAITKVVGSNS